MSDAKKYGWKIDECSHDWDLLKEELDTCWSKNSGPLKEPNKG